MLNLQSQAQAQFSAKFINDDILWIAELIARPTDFINGMRVLFWLISSIGWLYGVASDIRTAMQPEPERFTCKPYTAFEFGVMVRIIRWSSLAWGVLG